jgi:hypothetical protein
MMSTVLLSLTGLVFAAIPRYPAIGGLSRASLGIARDRLRCTDAAIRVNLAKTRCAS